MIKVFSQEDCAVAGVVTTIEKFHRYKYFAYGLQGAYSISDNMLDDWEANCMKVIYIFKYGYYQKKPQFWMQQLNRHIIFGNTIYRARYFQ